MRGASPSATALPGEAQARARLRPDGRVSTSAKPRVSLRSYRLLEKLWPYAPQYCRKHQRSEIVADIFDGWMNCHDMAPMIADDLVYVVRSYDPADNPRLYISWNPTPKGEAAIFGAAIVDGHPQGRDGLSGSVHDQRGATEGRNRPNSTSSSPPTPRES
jgi:hypothetical protein